MIRTTSFTVLATIAAQMAAGLELNNLAKQTPPIHEITQEDVVAHNKQVAETKQAIEGIEHDLDAEILRALEHEH